MLDEVMLTALGTEPKLRIMQLLLTAHPEGLVVGYIQSELDIPPSTLSHHLEKLRIEELVTVTRDKKFLWYTPILRCSKSFLPLP
jgi:DNA-binding transcriptional ArsR family regulator